jgi:hypothetical protein
MVTLLYLPLGHLSGNLKKACNQDLIKTDSAGTDLQVRVERSSMQCRVITAMVPARSRKTRKAYISVVLIAIE